MPKSISFRPRTSPIWELFKRVGPGVARCLLCRNILSFKSSISNLKRHLDKRHPGRIQTSVTCLLALVETHPCLWDHRGEAYGNFRLKQKAWNAIAARLCPKEDQKEAVTKLSEQFKSLRNRFFSKRSCSYSRHLSFMTPLLDDCNGKNRLSKETCEIEVKHEVLTEPLYNVDALTSQEEEDNDDEQCSTTEKDNNSIHPEKQCSSGSDDKCSSSPDVQQVTQKEPKSKLHVEIPPAYGTKCNLQINNADDDTVFLLSLAEEVKAVPKQFQMSFKVDLLSTFNQLIKKYENKN